MKNNILLLISGVACAALAWLFFAYFQNYALTILLLIFVIAVLAKPVKSKFSAGNNNADKNRTRRSD